MGHWPIESSNLSLSATLFESGPSCWFSSFSGAHVASVTKRPSCGRMHPDLIDLADRGRVEISTEMSGEPAQM
jgi:hypothetical protein